MSLIDFFNYHVRNGCWCIRKKFPIRMLLCDVWFKEIPKSTVFGHPYGITIRGGTIIGENCTFASNVTIGQRKSETTSAFIGNNVYFGAGCVVLGNVKIGNNVIVGANTTVLHDISDNTKYTGEKL